jgi:competence protein ComEC
VIVSHADTDHAGGVAGVAAHWPEAAYLTPDPSTLPQTVQGTSCRAGQSWQWDGVDFELLHPDQAAYDRNNSSCVLRISIGAQVVLLPGDIEREVEHRLLLAGLRSPLNLLVAPHHGSNSSSSPAFVTALQPEVVVHSSGHLNRFGHPAPAVLSRYAAVGTRQYRTSESGALSFELDATGIVGFEQWRQVHRRFWAPVAE